MARNGSEMGSTIDGAELGNEQRHAPPPALVPALSRDQLADLAPGPALVPALSRDPLADLAPEPALVPALSRDPLANENHAGGRHWAPGQARGKLATEQASFRARAKRAAAALAALALVATAAPASAEGVYFRIGGGYDWSAPATFTDRDCNVAGPPFALYGCGVGNDGLPIGAYGSFGGSPAFEAAVGFHAAPALRIETAVSFRPGFAFVGEANFTGTPDPQPVTASLGQAALMGWAYVDLGTAAGGGWPVDPFIGVGVGVSRNALSEMYFDFPGLTQPAWSETPGGTRFSPALGFAIGVSRQLTETLAIELAFRHVNYGVVGTDAGVMWNQRGGAPFALDIDETWTLLSTNAVMLSVRWGLGD